jgi:hypothetical protein
MWCAIGKTYFNLPVEIKRIAHFTQQGLCQLSNQHRSLTKVEGDYFTNLTGRDNNEYGQLALYWVFLCTCGLLLTRDTPFKVLGL